MALSKDDRVKNALDYNYGRDLEIKNPKLYRKYYNAIYDNADGILSQLPIMVSGKSLIKNYENIRFPLLGVFSTKDPIIPKENADVVKKYLPHSKIEYLEGYHASPQIHPEKVVKLIKDFIKTQEN